MKFLVDAQLPRKLSRFLTSKNFDSIHTLDLPGKNFTTDSEIIEICEKQNRVIITKDSDFYESKLLSNKPQKLIMVQTGNISNDLLISLFDANMERIISFLEFCDIVEITSVSIISK
jgi:predicted nuclease of predicted toxin-antitoxin system